VRNKRESWGKKGGGPHMRAKILSRPCGSSVILNRTCGPSIKWPALLAKFGLSRTAGQVWLGPHCWPSLACPAVLAKWNEKLTLMVVEKTEDTDTRPA